MAIQKIRLNGQWVEVDSSAVPIENGYIYSDTTRKLSAGENPPEDALNGDLWIDTNDLPEELAPTSIVWKERPAGDVDGVNRTFQTNQPYISGSLQVFINGIAQSQLVDESGAGSGVFELDTAPLIGDDITVQYQVRAVATGNAQALGGNTLTAILQAIYPVGSVFTSGESTMPALISGIGTWVRLNGRVIVGLDESQTEFDTVNETGGAKTHKLTKAELPNYDVYTFYRFTAQSGSNTSSAIRNEVTSYPTTINSGGSDQPHNNLQPYKVKYMWERVA